jgi:hypothetical protein
MGRGIFISFMLTELTFVASPHHYFFAIKSAWFYVLPTSRYLASSSSSFLLPIKNILGELNTLLRKC